MSGSTDARIAATIASGDRIISRHYAVLSGSYRRCKLCNEAAETKYTISYDHQKVDVLECTACGFHALDYLDPPFPKTEDNVILTDTEIAYIDKGLQSSSERFNWQLETVEKILVSPKGKRILDIGAGGGKFLSLMREKGAEVFGIEPNANRIAFARQHYGLKFRPELIDDAYWQNNPEMVGSFDAVCLWDVIEHVNSPVDVLKDAMRMLKPGGLIFIDTPTRNGLFYRLGAMSYKLTGGHMPFLLKTMYSPTVFAHKQIFTEQQMADTFKRLGMNVHTLNTFKELSFPKKFYLKRMVRSEMLATALVPFAEVFLRVIPIRNKMLAIARKPEA